MALQLSPLRHFATIPGRHRVAQDHQGSAVDQPDRIFLGNAWGHVVAPPRQGIIEAVAPYWRMASASIAFNRDLVSSLGWLTTGLRVDTIL